MSQRITVKSIITKPTKKEGTTITTIEAESGAKASTFNAPPELQSLHAGDVIEWDLIAEGKYLNITGWKLVESKPAPPTPVTADNGSMSKDEWNERDRTTRISIEAQIAFKGVMEHANAWIAASEGKADLRPLSPELKRLINSAYAWALKRLGDDFDTMFPPRQPDKTTPASPPPAPATPSTTPTPSKPASSPTGTVAGTVQVKEITFNNLGDFMAAALGKGYKTKISIEEKLGQKLELIPNLEEAFKKL